MESLVREKNTSDENLRFGILFMLLILIKLFTLTSIPETQLREQPLPSAPCLPVAIAPGTNPGTEPGANQESRRSGPWGGQPASWRSYVKKGPTRSGIKNWTMNFDMKESSAHIGGDDDCFPSARIFGAACHARAHPLLAIARARRSPEQPNRGIIL